MPFIVVMYRHTKKSVTGYVQYNVDSLDPQFFLPPIQDRSRPALHPRLLPQFPQIYHLHILFHSPLNDEH